MEIREYFTPLLKWWWLIVSATLVAGISSFWATQQQPDVYRSTTALMIGNAIENPNPSNNDLYITQQLAAGYVNLANRASVRNDALEALGLDRLPKDIVVRQLTGTNIIEIIVTDTDQARAQAVAAELARQLVLRSPTSQAEENTFVNELLSNYETAIVETRDQLAAKQEELGNLTSARDIARAQTEIAEMESSLRTLETNYTTLLASTEQGATNTVQIIENANFPYNPVNPNPLITIIIASGIGFVLSASAAYIMEYLDDTIKTENVVMKLTELPTLAGIADIKSDENHRLVTISHPRAPVSEAFRILRTGIQYTSVDNPNRSLLITSSIPGEGKSTTSANLAVVLAQAGFNVLLIDSDLRLPSQHEMFDLPNKRGLTNLLLDFDATKREEEIRLLINDSVQSTRVEGLQLLTSGLIPPNPSELLGSKKMKMLLDALLKQYDYVIFDSPPVLSVTDAVILSTQVDAALLVIRANKSRKGQLKQSVKQLGEVRTNLIGCVLNSLSPKSQGYSAYYYYKEPYQADGKDVHSNGTGETGKLRRRLLGGETKKAV
ncbi:MAG: polysaccharide biosynthesis tyrosine autokinase [Anaerolineales bacterium]|nr:polysaccharide biosynthesis tyrosine autokinase [Anaerolineales bacterium]MCB8968151.1 polysaccharide biosynthesis tyrosine autokinase [Ardenticatenaceae bacterium]